VKAIEILSAGLGLELGDRTLVERSMERVSKEGNDARCTAVGRVEGAGRSRRAAHWCGGRARPRRNRQERGGGAREIGYRSRSRQEAAHRDREKDADSILPRSWQGSSRSADLRATQRKLLRGRRITQFQVGSAASLGNRAFLKHMSRWRSVLRGRMAATPLRCSPGAR